MMRQIAFHNHGAAPIHSNSSTAQWCAETKNSRPTIHSTAETEQHSTADSRDGAAQQQRSAYAVTQSDLAIL